MKKLVIFIMTIAATFFITACKKTKLTGDNEKLVGTWQWYGGWSDGGSTDLTLDLAERGKYKLYKGSDKIEYGRLLTKGEFLEFKSDNDIDKLKKKHLFLNGRLIVNSNDTVIGIGCAHCYDAPSSGFRKK